jgi:aminoglycoside phosphotransferase (APT) family kinase protein
LAAEAATADFPVVRLARWLAQAKIGTGDDPRLEKFAGGQSNPTYRLRLDGADYVLRRKPFGPLLPSAHAIEREFRLISALHPAGFPVPAPIGLCEDEDVIGAPFYVMTMMEGRNFTDGLLPGLSSEDRTAIYNRMADTLAHLHTTDIASVGLSDYGRPGNFFERQVARWIKQYRAAQTDEIDEVERLIEFLPRTVPQQRSTAIIHGDYRIDNLIFDGRCQPIAVIDWELSTLGDPLADLAYMAMNWVLPVDGRAGLGGARLEELGIPTLEQIVARYCAAAGLEDVPALPWYFAFNLFRLVGIIQGVKRRLADGNASSAEAEKVIAKIGPLAKAGWEQALLSGRA